MAIADLIPGLGDTELANLRDNAERLTASGAPRQQEQASALLPLIDAELAQRAAQKPVALKTAPLKATAKSRKAKVQAAVEAVAEMEADEEPANDDDPVEL